MSLRLSGINPLSYMGVEPYTPPALVIRPFPPTVNDFQNINLGTFWLVRPNSVITLWVLISVEGGAATWVQLYPAGGGGSGASEFPTDSETANELAGVLNIFGDTRVTTSGAGNTVTLHLSGTVASIYATNDGDATPSGGTLEILGGSNINTFGSGNTVEVNLNTSVTLADNLSVGGTVTVTDFSSGVVQSGITGLLESTNGTAGQLLIGGGVEPVWANLTSTGNTVTITNGANSINLESTGGGTPGTTVCFSSWQDGDFAVPSAGPIFAGITPYLMGSGIVMSIEYNEGAAFYPGDGAGGQAIFTAPVTGRYEFTFGARIVNTGGSNSNFIAQIIDPVKIWSTIFTSGYPMSGTGSQAEVSAAIQLNQFDQVTFRLLVGTTTLGYTVGGPFLYPPATNPLSALQYITRIFGSLVSEG